MSETPYNHYALYEPDAAPDLTATGEYNSAVMAIDADIHDEETERKAADANLKAAIDAEAATRHDEDDRLDKAIAAVGRRVDNAEVEISSNSADLTGIKGLTYGEQHVRFVENSDGEYSSPALEEIAKQIGQGFSVLEITNTTTSIGTDALARLKASWPKITVRITAGPAANNTEQVMLPVAYLAGAYTFISPCIFDNNSDHSKYMPALSITGTGEGKVDIEPFTVPDPYWPHVKNKPFTAIGPGLMVMDDTLFIDPRGFQNRITARTKWSELEADLIQ